MTARPITPELIREVEAHATLLFSKAQIDAGLDKMTQKMREVLEKSNPILLTVMNGGLFVASEIGLRLNFPLQMDYIHATRYHGEVTGSSIHWKREPSLDLNGRVVVIVDDILDGGITLQAVKDYCHGHGASKTYTAVLMDKVNARLPEGLAHPDFVAIEEPENHYVYGFGLDYHDYLRNIPAIYCVAPQHMF
ncbi:MAG: hypoxanthine-guanine phosphoribosyltransferase [Gammaproteobacteria bacterium]|jgi:hypoxanthine phosphoribosyltransferase|nr:hypoxanthine-guanine phosphoribosyltransferase [Gammaproteobacteria bacterium]